MALSGGNLLTDPAANSFISLADADTYLGAGANSAWAAADVASKEAALVNASRWMAVSLAWCDNALADADLARVGHAAARMAVEALTVDLWASDAVGGDLTQPHRTLAAGTRRTSHHIAGPAQLA